MINLMNLAVGLYAMASAFTVDYSIFIGDRAGEHVLRGHCVILIGRGLNPGTELNYYINVNGVEYPNAVRRERWFQDLARQAARIEVDSMTDGDVTRRRSEAMRAIDNMSFHEETCAGSGVS